MNALLVLLLLCTPVGEKCPCPEVQLAKYECGETWECVEGSCDDFTVMGDCQLATVSGTFDALWVKAGQHCEEQENPIHAIEGQDVSHVNICAGHPTSVRLSSFRARALRWWERLWRQIK